MGKCGLLIYKLLDLYSSQVLLELSALFPLSDGCPSQSSRSYIYIEIDHHSSDLIVSLLGQMVRQA